jgi:hypothetical protein
VSSQMSCEDRTEPAEAWRRFDRAPSSTDADATVADAAHALALP